MILPIYFLKEDQMHSQIYHLHALSALHAGTGQGGGVIDLPIAREKSTHLPIVPGSSVKGVLRGCDNHRALFGPDTENASDHAGALAVSDARLLCLPVRSLGGTFAWVTCPLVLRRYQRDLNATQAPPTTLGIPTPAENGILVCDPSALKLNGNQVFLEDLDLDASEDPQAQTWAEAIGQAVFGKPEDAHWQALFLERFAIVSDAVFDFLAETATEIATRIKLKPETRTVEKGGLWIEESLPAESLLWGIVACDRSRHGEAKSGKDLLKSLPAEQRLQVGGKASVGRGQVRWVLSRGE
jgi:CRISPR-associated protein Cmr4